MIWGLVLLVFVWVYVLFGVCNLALNLFIISTIRSVLFLHFSTLTISPSLNTIYLEGTKKTYKNKYITYMGYSMTNNISTTDKTAETPLHTLPKALSWAARTRRAFGRKTFRWGCLCFWKSPFDSGWKKMSTLRIIKAWKRPVAVIKVSNTY